MDQEDIRVIVACLICPIEEDLFCPWGQRVLAVWVAGTRHEFLRLRRRDSQEGKQVFEIVVVVFLWKLLSSGQVITDEPRHLSGPIRAIDVHRRMVR